MIYKNMEGGEAVFIKWFLGQRFHFWKKVVGIQYGPKMSLYCRTT